MVNQKIFICYFTFWGIFFFQKQLNNLLFIFFCFLVQILVSVFGIPLLALFSPLGQALWHRWARLLWVRMEIGDLRPLLNLDFHSTFCNGWLFMGSWCDVGIWIHRRSTTSSEILALWWCYRQWRPLVFKISHQLLDEGIGCIGVVIWLSLHLVHVACCRIMFVQSKEDALVAKGPIKFS